MNEIFARDLNGEIVSPSDQGYDRVNKLHLGYNENSGRTEQRLPYTG